jgi:purine-binding chemotaxis protein CheW
MSAPDTAVVPRHAPALQPDMGPALEPCRQCICFRAGGEWLALPIQRVREIQALPPLVRVPNAPADIVGIVNLRGRVLTLLSLPAARLGTMPEPPTYCLVLDLGDPDPYVGLAVHAVGEVVGVPLSALDPPPPDGRGRAILEAVFQADGRVVGLLDLGRLYAGLLADWGIAVERRAL